MRSYFICSVVIGLAVMMSSVYAVVPSMPYRPGYGLGSWIPDSVINSMRKEADVRSEILLIDNLQVTTESVLREIEFAAEKDTAEMTDDSGQTIGSGIADKEQLKKKLRVSRDELWKKKMDAYNDLVDAMTGQVEALRKASTTTTGIAPEGVFTTFGSSIGSPIDWSASKITPQPRAADTININVDFIQFHGAKDKAASEAHQNRVLTSYERVVRPTKGSVGSKTTLGKQTGDFLQSTLNSQNNLEELQGTLLFTAFATHRNVQQFDNVKLDVDNMYQAWNYYHPEDPISDPILKYEEFNDQLGKAQDQPQAQAKRINMVSEIFRGSSFVGVVHLLKDDTMSEQDTMQAVREARNKTRKLENQIRTATNLADRTGSNEMEKELVKKFANILSESKLKIRFDLINIGWIPKLSSNTIDMAVQSFGENFRAQNFAAQPFGTQDESTAKPQNMLQDNMGSAIKNTLVTLDKLAADAQVLDIHSFMKAFDDFVQNAQSSSTADGIGAPIGMNVRQFTKLNIMGGLINKYLNVDGVGMGMDLGMS